VPNSWELFVNILDYALIVVALCALVIPIGAGLALGSIQRHFHFSFIVFLWFFLGSAVAITSWIWLYLFDFSIGDVGKLLLVIWVACLARIVRFIVKGDFRSTQKIVGVRETVVALVLLLTASFLFFVVPRTVDGTVTPRQRMGPDALGYANAIDALLNDGSFANLRDLAIERSGLNLEYELFDWNVLGVHRIPEKSLSIKTEFIVGALRIGFPAIVASVTRIVGYEHLLSVMYLTSGTYTAIGGLLVFGFGRVRKLGILGSLALAVVSMVNVNLLVGHHEGGVAQTFSYAAVVGLVVAVTTLEISSKMRFLLFYLAGIHLLSSYVDMYFVVCALIFLWYLVARFRLDVESVHQIRLLVLSWGLAGVTLLPLTARLPKFVLRRVGDARQAGWQWDSWTELTGIFGISDPYLSVPDSLISQAVLIAFVILIYQVVIDQTRQPQLMVARSLALAVGGLSSSFYLYSRYIADFSNYQWFKLVGTFLGPSAAILVVANVLPRPLSLSKRRVFRVSGIAVATAVCLLTLNTSFTYARQFWSDSSFVDPGAVHEIVSQNSREVLSSFVLFGHYGWDELALTPFWEASYLNRRDMGVTPFLPPDEPVGLVIRVDECPNWMCLSRVPRANVIEISSRYRLIDLNLNSTEVRSANSYLQWVQVNRALSRLNAPYVEGNWTDLNSEFQYQG